MGKYQQKHSTSPLKAVFNNLNVPNCYSYCQQVNVKCCHGQECKTYLQDHKNSNSCSKLVTFTSVSCLYIS